MQESSINCIRLSCVSFRMKCKSTKDNTFTAAAKTLVPQGCLRTRPTMTTEMSLQRRRDDVDPANMFASLQASQCLGEG